MCCTSSRTSAEKCCAVRVPAWLSATCARVCDAPGRDVCAGILHTILFCRTLGVVRPKDVVLHLFSEPIVHVRCALWGAWGECTRLTTTNTGAS